MGCLVIPEILVNGEWKQSKLFKDLLSNIGDREKAKEIYSLVHSNEFINWFGDWTKGEGSKIVDENGEPQLVYRGANKDKTQFNYSNVEGKIGTGIYLTKNKEYAQGFAEDKKGTNYPLFLNAKNIIEFNNPVNFQAAAAKHFNIKYTAELTDKMFSDYAKVLQKEGKIIIIGKNKNNTEYIAFESNQVKSIYNNGEFSQSDNIFKLVGKTKTTKDATNKYIKGAEFINKVLATLYTTKFNLERALSKSKLRIGSPEWIDTEKQIAKIKEEIDNILANENSAAIMVAAKRQLEYIDEAFKKPSIKETTLINIANILQSWKAVRELAQGSDNPQLQELYKQLNEQLGEKERTWAELAKKTMFKIINKESGLKYQFEELYGPIDDVNTWTSLAHDASNSNSKLIQALDLILKNTVQKTNEDYRGFVKKHESIVERLKKSAAFLKHGWKIFYKKDEFGNVEEKIVDGKKIKSIVREYSDHYYKMKDEAIKKGRYYYSQWSGKNEALVDIRAIVKGSETEKKHELDFLNRNFRPEEVTTMIEEATLRYEQFNQARIEHEASLEEGLTDEEIAKVMQAFDERNDPAYLAKFHKSTQTREDLAKLMPTVTYREDLNWQYTYAIPRRTDINGKDLGNYSKDYIYIQSIPELKEFYDHYLEYYEKYLRYLPYLPNGMSLHSIPAIMKDFWQRVFKDGLTGAWAGLKREMIDRYTVKPLDSSKSITSQQDYIPTTGIDEESMKTDFNARVEDLDVILDEFVHMGMNFHHKSRIEDFFLLGQRVLNEVGKLTKKGNTQILNAQGEPEFVKGGLALNKEMLDYLVEAMIYGKNKGQDTTLGEIDGKPISVTKIGDNLMAWTQLKGMALNTLGAANNLLFGKIANHILAAGGLYYTDKENRQAELDMASFSSLKAKIENIIQNPIAKKMLGLFDRYDLLHESRESIYTGTKPAFFSLGKLKLTLYGMHKAGEFEVQGSLANAMMRFKKVKVKGKEVSLWSALDENGNLAEGVEDFTQSDLNLFMLKIKEVIKQTHGNYDPTSPILGKKHLFGRMLAQFRSWMPQAIQNRIAAERNHALLGVQKGRYRSVFAKNKSGEVIGALEKLEHMFKWLAMNPNAFEQLSDIDKANMKMNMRELLYIVGISTAGLLTAAAMKDEDDDDYWYLVYLANLGFRIETDLTYFVNPLKFDQMTKNVLPVVSTLSDLRGLLYSVGKALNGDFTDRYSRNRVGVSTIKNIPVLNNINKIHTQINIFYGDFSMGN